MNRDVFVYHFAQTAAPLNQDEPPLRWAARADAVATFEQKAKALLDQAYRELSSSLAFDEAESGSSAT